MKWGVRRYQNKDGTLTTAGKKHYDTYNKYKKLHNTYSNLKRKSFDHPNNEKAYLNAHKAAGELDKYEGSNRKSIKIGRKIAANKGDFQANKYLNEHRGTKQAVGSALSAVVAIRAGKKAVKYVLASNTWKAFNANDMARVNRNMGLRRAALGVIAASGSVTLGILSRRNLKNKLKEKTS